MPPLIVLLAESLNELPQPPGTTPTVTVTVTPAASATATPLPEATVATVATPTPAPVSPQPGDGGLSTGYVILIVLVVLGAVVLIAWLLKPLVARRLIAEDVAGRGGESDEPPATVWPARQETAAGRPAVVSVSETDEVEGELVTVDVAEKASRERVVEEPTTTTEPAIARVASPGVVSSGSSEAPGTTLDAETIVAITLTVRELLEFANTGQLLRGFDLYTESYLTRFRGETGLNEAQFAAEYGSIPAPPPEARIELAAVSDVGILPDGRLSALISFGNGEKPPQPERFVFVRSAGRWLIDDIAGTG